MMKQEQLYACPLCHRPGFTSRGLRAHWCPAKPAPAGNKKHSAPLTREEWARAVHPTKAKAAFESLQSLHNLTYPKAKPPSVKNLLLPPGVMVRMVKTFRVIRRCGHRTDHPANTSLKQLRALTGTQCHVCHDPTNS